MAVIEIAKIQVRRGQEGITGVPQLDPGEFGWAQDTQHLYIGKRIEEGASTDENSRILTDKDLQNIFHLIGGGLTGSAASTSTYRYRDDLDWGKFNSTTTTIARKLDNFVSLTDFTQYPLQDDITLILQDAIQTIYANNYYGTDTVRTLQIPAGNFKISAVVDLPPYTNLIGEGPGLTVLTLNSNGTSMFRTVDGLGNNYDNTMQTGQYAAKYVSIEDMTLSYKKGSINEQALVMLDNVENPYINNVEFTTFDANISTSTYVNTGTGINIRGNLGSDLAGAVMKNAHITNCHFKNMRNGVRGVGVVGRTLIENNNFTFLQKGIFISSTTPTTHIPQQTLVSSNTFEFINLHGIHISTNTTRTNLISTHNVYKNVGNLGTLPDSQVNYVAEPVLKFDALGNASVDDIFTREDAAFTATFYYNPLASANATIQSNLTHHRTIVGSANNQPVYKIPLTGKDQIGILEYSLSNDNMSRKGILTINISSDGYASVSDSYNYSELVDDASTLLVFSTNMSQGPYQGGVKNYVSVICSNLDTVNTTLTFTINLTV